MGQTTTQEMDPGAFRGEVRLCPPAQMVDLKALMGDASDNVPGVPGVGEKTALSLLRDNGTLAEVYARLDQETLETRPVMKKRLAEGRESAFLSYDLCTIRRDAPWTSPRRRRTRKPANTALFAGAVPETGLPKTHRPDGAGGPGRQPVQPPCPTPPQEVVWVRDAQAQALLDQWQGQTVGVLALPDLTALAVCWGKRGTRWPSSKRPPCRGTRPSWQACWALASPSWGYHSKGRDEPGPGPGAHGGGLCL